MKGTRWRQEINRIAVEAMSVAGSMAGLRQLPYLAHGLSLAAMNIGNATRSIKHSGELWLLKQLRSRGATARQVIVFDVGAHVGQYLGAVLSVFGSDAYIYSFEPCTILYERLCGNYKHLQNVRLFQLAVGKMAGGVKLHWGENMIPSAFAHDRSGSGKTEWCEEVAVDTIDNVAAAAGISRISLLKVDVEGMELAVLQGAARMIEEGRVDCIQFEFGYNNLLARTYLRDFYEILTAQYDLYRLLRRSLCPLGEYSSRNEIFVSATNYVALRRDGEYANIGATIR